MKKLYILLVAIMCLSMFLPTFIMPAHATMQTEYLRVIDYNTPFYKNINDEEPVFYLPYSYYVKIIGHSGENYHIEIYGDNGQVAIDGFTPSNRLFNDNLPIESPYLNLTITTVCTTVLYDDKNLLSPIQYIFPERTLYYYGEMTTEQGKLFYVGYNNRLGYIKEEDVYPFIIKNHPNDLPSSSITSPQEELLSPAEQTGVFGLKTIIIVCLIFAGLVAVFISLKNSHSKQKNINYYEENEYE